MGVSLSRHHAVGELRLRRLQRLQVRPGGHGAVSADGGEVVSGTHTTWKRCGPGVGGEMMAVAAPVELGSFWPLALLLFRKLVSRTGGLIDTLVRPRT